MKFKPNFTRVWTGLGDPTVWHFNNLGFRERAVFINKPQNIYRIVVIGDSIVMGFGVEDFEAFPRELEEKLKAETVDPGIIHFEVLNMGLQGYSSGQYLAVLKEEALRLNPDLILVAVYPSNDIGGVAGLYIDRLYAYLISLPDLIPYRLNEFLKRNSRFHLFLLTKYYSIVQKYQSKYSQNDQTDELGWQLMQKDVLEMKRSAEAKNKKLVILPMPKPKEVSGELKPTTHSRLIQVLEENEVSYYDSLPELKEYRNVKALYLDDLDDHFSTTGNEYFASILAEYLWDNNLAPKQPEQ